MITHSGKMVPAKADFFAQPPSEIGRVLSGETTLRIGKKPRGFFKLILHSLLISVAIAGGIILLVLLFHSGPKMRFFPKGDFIVLACCSFPFVFGLLAIYGKFIHQCSYVGENGIARFTLESNRSANPRSYVVLFEHVDYVLSKHQQVSTSHGSEVSRSITWKTFAKAPSYVPLTIDHAGIDTSRRTKQSVALVVAGEAAWGRFAWQRLEEAWETAGEVAFVIEKGASIVGRLVLNATGIQIRQDPSTVFVPSTEITSVGIHNGVFILKTTGRDGIPKRFKVPTANIGNACLLMTSLYSFLRLE